MRDYYIKTNLNEAQLSNEDLRKVIPEELHSRITIDRILNGNNDNVGVEHDIVFKVKEETE